MLGLIQKKKRPNQDTGVMGTLLKNLAIKSDSSFRPNNTEMKTRYTRAYSLYENPLNGVRERLTFQDAKTLVQDIEKNGGIFLGGLKNKDKGSKKYLYLPLSDKAPNYIFLLSIEGPLSNHSTIDAKFRLEVYTSDPNTFLPCGIGFRFEPPHEDGTDESRGSHKYPHLQLFVDTRDTDDDKNKVEVVGCPKGLPQTVPCLPMGGRVTNAVTFFLVILCSIYGTSILNEILPPGKCTIDKEYTKPLEDLFCQKLEGKP